MKKGKTLFYIGLVMLIIGLALTIAGRTLQNKQNYENAVAAIDEGDYQTAVDTLTSLAKADYKDSKSLLEKAEAALENNTESQDAAETEQSK